MQENLLGQKFVVDATLFVDLLKAGRSDNVHDTVNYADVYRYASTTTCAMSRLRLRVCTGILQAHQDCYGRSTSQAIGISSRAAG